jgi:hypothetical protein
MFGSHYRDFNAFFVCNYDSSTHTIYYGQDITNHYNYMFQYVRNIINYRYNIQWYESPLFVQKIILFLLQTKIIVSFLDYLWSLWKV